MDINEHKKYFQKWTGWEKKGAPLLQNETTCAKPVQPRTRGTNTYTNVIYINAYLLLYPIGKVNSKYIDCVLIAYCCAVLCCAMLCSSTEGQYAPLAKHQQAST